MKLWDSQAWSLFACACWLSIGGCQPPNGGGPPPPPHGSFVCATGLRFHFIGVRRDDGSKGPPYTHDKLDPYVAKANALYGPAGLTFTYDHVVDWEDMNSTLLWEGLTAYFPGTQEQLDARVRAQEIARQRPGKIVVFFRKDEGNDYAAPRVLGPKPPDASWDDGLDYISFWGSSDHANPMPDFDQQSNQFAHELGHYLGLYHTFPGAGVLQTAEAIARAATEHPSLANGGPCASDAACIPGTRCASGKCLDTFDGDLIADTPEDPSSSAWQNGCAASACPEATRSDCSCTTFANQKTTRIISAVPCTTASQCGVPLAASSSVASCESGACTFSLTPMQDNVMSYYPSSNPVVTEGQLRRIQESLSAVPERNFLCNSPCALDLSDPTNAAICASYDHYRGCGAENQRCCRPSQSCEQGLSCFVGTCRKNSSVAACNQCTTDLNACRQRCGSDARCKCLCENEECVCRTRNACEISCLQPCSSGGPSPMAPKP